MRNISIEPPPATASGSKCGGDAEGASGGLVRLRPSPLVHERFVADELLQQEASSGARPLGGQRARKQRSCGFKNCHIISETRKRSSANLRSSTG